jgi:hypothetical protein
MSNYIKIVLSFDHRLTHTLSSVQLLSTVSHSILPVLIDYFRLNTTESSSHFRGSVGLPYMQSRCSRHMGSLRMRPNWNITRI